MTSAGPRAGDVVIKLVVDFEKARAKHLAPWRPPPLYPPGLKLGDNAMPLPGDVFSSAMAGTGLVVEAAALRPIWRSWRETPVGTLPLDDRLLREISGMDRRAWKAKRQLALRPFVECRDGRLHCSILVGLVARLVSNRAAKRAQDGSKRASEWTHFANWFAERSRGYAENGGPNGLGERPTRPDSFLPSIKQSVLAPRAREADRPDPTPTRPKNARQDHEGQVEAALPADWRPSRSDVEAIIGERPDLDDMAIERQRNRFIERARGTALPAEWSRRFVAFAKNGRGKPWSAPQPSAPLANDFVSSAEKEASLWRARFKGSAPGKLPKIWPGQWGPKPGEPGCQVPRALLTELGFEPS